jgi:D-aminopeptidase
MTHALDSSLNTIPRAYPGPGGAIAVLRHGELLASHSWGWANAELRIPFTPKTLFRMCSITKQFTCGTVLSAFPDPTALNPNVAARLPLLEQQPPTALDLCHNQSGLRDYWAVAMLHGAPAESPFGDAEAARVIAGTRTLQFTPGTRYSYCNQNFRILSDIVQHRSGRGFAELLRTHMFEPAGMATAFLAAETSAMPDGTTGYEGTQETGFRPAINRILWTGDAGLGASLNDMIAWERHIDATRDNPTALYNRLSAPVTFANGAASAYGFGLSRRPQCGRPATGHGGALRGWRSHRVYLPAERISVVVMFNHPSDAHAAAEEILSALLGESKQTPPALPPPPWLGAYIEPETGLSVRIDTAVNHQLRLRYGHAAERLDLQPDGTASNDAVTLRPEAGALRMHRPLENQSSLLQPCETAATPAIEGAYRCGELDATLTIENTAGQLYGAFSGCLGQGRMELLDPIAANVWALPCPRALDHTPPGDWTLRITGNDTIEVGCWLARGLTYSKEASASF